MKISTIRIHSFFMRFVWYRRFKSLRPTIKKIFWAILLSNLCIELLPKELFNSPLILIYSKLSYSILAAIILYYFNVHWPNEEKKVKTFLYVSNKVSEIHIESRWMLDLLKIEDKPLQNKTYEQISSEVQRACNLIDENKQFRDVNGIPHENWYSFLRQKGALINELINELLVFEGLLNSEVLECLIFIEHTLTTFGLGLKKTRIGRADLKQYSTFISQLYINSAHATHLLSVKLVAYELEYHKNYLDRPNRLAKQRESVMKLVRIEHEKRIEEGAFTREDLS